MGIYPWWVEITYVVYLPSWVLLCKVIAGTMFYKLQSVLLFCKIIIVYPDKGISYDVQLLFTVVVVEISPYLVTSMVGPP